VATIDVGYHPLSVAVDPATHRAYVTNPEENSVSVIDTRHDAVIATITVDQWPNHVAVNPVADRAYVTNYESDRVSVIDTKSNTVIATMGVSDGLVSVAVNEATHRAYVVSAGSDGGNNGRVWVLDVSRNADLDAQRHARYSRTGTPRQSVPRS